MSIIVRDSGDIYFDGTHNVSVMSIFVDSAADLTGLVQYEGIYFQLGSDALDVSTGDKYRMKSDGTWVLQPSDNAWENVYTKTEIDELLTHKSALSFTPGGVISHLLNCTFTIPDSSRTLRFTVGKLNSTQNYLQIYVNGVDKGYIIFDVSRNMDEWGE